MNKKNRLIAFCMAVVMLAGLFGTCTASFATTTARCPRCGATRYEILKHTSQATCFEPAGEYAKCATCGKEWWIVAVAQLTHEFEVDEVFPPTCTETGYTHYLCIHCNTPKNGDLTDALGHDYKDVVTKQPACEEDGESIETCARCEATGEVKVLPKTGHAWKTLNTVEAKCTTGGYTLQECTICSKTQRTNETDPLGHDMERVEEVPATFGKAGMRAHYKCRRCGLLFLDPSGDEPTTEEELTIPALLHDLVHVDPKIATCTEKGNIEHYACTDCDKCFADPDGKNELSASAVFIDALGHDYQPSVTKPDCLHGGNTTYTCSRCGDTYDADPAPALGHDLEYVARVEPGEDTPGTQAHYKCKRCGALFMDPDGKTPAKQEDLVISPTGHAYEATVTQPTCTQNGYVTYTCKHCGNTYKGEEMPALGHSLIHVAAEAAWCETTGRAEYWECSRCHKLFKDAQGSEETTLAGLAVDALGHDLEHIEEQPATEQAQGIKAHWVCKRCGKIFLDAKGQRPATEEDLTIPKREHTYTDKVVDPTCTEGGYTEHTCTGCAHTYRDNKTDPLGHDLEKVEAVPATETQPGAIEHYKCKRCGALFFDPEGTEPATEEEIKVPATGHVYTDTVKEPTCEEGGYTTHTCTGCGDTYTDSEKDPLGHDLEHVPAVAPTVDKDGVKEHYRCKRCGKLFWDADGQKPVIDPSEVTDPATGHNYVDKVTKPTCEEKGYTEHICQDCGETLRDTYTDPLGHDLEKAEAIAPTDMQNGLKEHYRCKRCGKLFWDSGQMRPIQDPGEVIDPATGHNYTDKVVDPTCTEGGYTQHTCKDCGHVYTDAYTDALGHKLVAVPAVEPTEDTNGMAAHWKCERCGKLFADANGELETTEKNLVIPATRHTYEDKVVDPTCTDRGYTEHTCKDCNHTYKDNYTDPLGHKLVEVPEKAPTEDENGMKAHWKCERCGKLFLNETDEKEVSEADLVIPATGHTYEDTVIPPTCTEGGYTQHTCKDCDHTYTDSETDPLGHDLEKVDGKETTEEENGLKEHWKCKRCGKLFLDANGEQETTQDALVLPATDHRYKDTVVPPTCEEGGYTEHVCQDCDHTYRDNETPARGHTLTHVEAKEPTTTEDGNIEYWKCEVCGKYFSDAAGKNEIDPNSVILPKLCGECSASPVPTGCVSCEPTGECSTTPEPVPTSGSVIPTGDSRNAGIWGLCSMLALGVLCVLIAKRRAKTERNS